MSKWTCRCDNPINDHIAPNPNAFSVHSDEWWEENDSKFDQDNKIKFEDISDASFYMW